MTFKSDEQLIKHLRKRVEYDLGRKSWAFNGVKFNSTAYYFEKEFFTIVDYVCDLRQIQVTVRREKYPVMYEIIAENVFNGDSAISDCITWVVKKLVEVYKLLNERVTPYLFSKDLYEKALSRPLNLQEG